MYSVAIVGAGIGREHAAGYATLPSHYRIDQICDLDADRGRALAEQYGAGYTPDFAQVLSSGVDIVNICLPPHLHFQTVLAAVRAGKIVICEKPLVTTLRDADLLAESAQPGQVFPVFQYRFGTGMAQLRAVQKAGLTGRFYAGTLETHWDRDGAYYANEWRGTWAGEQGGAVLGHAIHIHDMLTHIAGPVDQVFADLATRVNQIETEDCAALTLRMADGAVVSSSVTLGAAGNTSRLRLMFQGVTVASDCAAYAPAAAPWTFTARAPTEQAQIDAVLHEIQGAAAGFTGFFAAVAQALAGQPSDAPSLTDGRRSIELVTAIYAAARGSQPVRLPLGADHPMYDGWGPAG